jgi:hypothetical protein
MKLWMKRVAELNIEHFRRLLSKGLGDRPMIEGLLREEQKKLAAIEGGEAGEPPPSGPSHSGEATAASESGRG